MLPDVQRADLRGNARFLPGFALDAEGRPLEVECLQRRDVEVRALVPDEPVPTAGLLRPKRGWLRPEDACQVVEAERLPPSGWRLRCLGGGSDLQPGTALLLSSGETTAEVVVTSVSGAAPPEAQASYRLRLTDEGVRQGSVNDGDRLVARGSLVGVARGAQRVAGAGAGKKIEAVLERRLGAGEVVVATPSGAEFTLESEAEQGALVVTAPTCGTPTRRCAPHRGGRHRAPEGRGRSRPAPFPWGPPQRHREAHPAGPGAGLPARRRGAGQPLEAPESGQGGGRGGARGAAGAAAVAAGHRAAGEPGREAVGRPGHHVRRRGADAYYD